MKNNWIRFLAGALVSVMLVGAFALTGGMKGGKSTEGLLYQASGLHPDGEMLVVDGRSSPVRSTSIGWTTSVPIWRASCRTWTGTPPCPRAASPTATM